MTAAFIDEARDIIGRLDQLDRRRVVFGASRHGYRFSSPASESALAGFEAQHSVELPAPYRSFLSQLGNGGPGPYYGIEPLDVAAAHVGKPSPHTAAFETDEGGELDGMLRIAEYGCGIDVLITVNGDAAGWVWHDARCESGVLPALGAEKKPMTFDVWWLQIMGAHLELFERALEMMTAGTDHENIHQELEPRYTQLQVDETMLSIMNCDPSAKPEIHVDKPWGAVCGLVAQHLPAWRQSRH